MQASIDQLEEERASPSIQEGKNSVGSCSQSVHLALLICMAPWRPAQRDLTLQPVQSTAKLSKHIQNEEHSF